MLTLDSRRVRHSSNNPSFFKMTSVAAQRLTYLLGWITGLKDFDRDFYPTKAFSSEDITFNIPPFTYQAPTKRVINSGASWTGQL